MPALHPTTPRRIATAGRVAVVAGSGLALGALTAHVQADALAAAAVEPAATVPAEPTIVTIVHDKHVKSDPVIVYRQAPPEASPADDQSGDTGSSNRGPSRSLDAAAAPVPAAGPPAATSKAS